MRNASVPTPVFVSVLRVVALATCMSWVMSARAHDASKYYTRRQAEPFKSDWTRLHRNITRHGGGGVRIYVGALIFDILDPAPGALVAVGSTGRHEFEDWRYRIEAPAPAMSTRMSRCWAARKLSFVQRDARARETSSADATMALGL
jgi:hypothetical protein